MHFLYFLRPCNVVMKIVALIISRCSEASFRSSGHSLLSTMAVPTENTRLLLGLPRRPPLLTVPLSQSIRSGKNIESMLQHHDIESIDLDLINSKEFDWYAYIAYYLPVLRWLPQYSRNSLAGDALAGVSLASFQIPLVMSLATSLAKLPPLVGLYSAATAAMIYAVLGGVPVLVVGPLPATGVLYGQMIEKLLHSKDGYSNFLPLEISSTISVGLSGVLLATGLLRWGFLDNVLSRSLLKGFIGAMGIIMIVNQFSIQMGLQELATHFPHALTLDKLAFAAEHLKAAHVDTSLVTVVTLATVLSIRKLKAVLISKHNIKRAVYFPELLGMVVIATGLSYHYDWESLGIKIVGNLNGGSKNEAIELINPFSLSRLPLFKQVFATSFLCAILGFFDSSTATRALGARYNYNVSSNRELVALGMCNFALTLFGGMPSFGALGRSKVNIFAGATTPLASVIMSCTILMAIHLFLPALYFLPECVLSLSTTIIGITVLEEVPHDIAFFWSIGGYEEILVLATVFCATLLWSVEMGVMLGVIIAVVRVIKQGTRSRIHILGRVPNTSVFRNSDELIEESFASHIEHPPASGKPGENLAEFVAEIQQIEGVLIIEIPEPLNFANLGDLRSKLTRIEKFGTLSMHPSQPSISGFETGAIKFIIIDCKGMISIDSSATQALYEIVKRYSEVNNICVSFSRVPTSTQVRDRFIRLGIAQIVNSNYSKFHRSRSYLLVETAGLSQSFNVSKRLGDGFFLSIDDALRAFDIDSV